MSFSPFARYALMYKADEMHDVFVRKCCQLKEAIEQHKLEPTVSCRNCWRLADVEGITDRYKCEEIGNKLAP